MLPVAAETRPPLLRLRIACILLWAALALLVAAQFLRGYVGVEPLWTVWTDLHLLPGWIGRNGGSFSDGPCDRLLAFVPANCLIAATPWCLRLVARSALARHLVLGLSIASLVMICRADWIYRQMEPWHLEMPPGVACLTIASFLHLSGVCLLQAQRPVTFAQRLLMSRTAFGASLAALAAAQLPYGPRAGGTVALMHCAFPEVWRVIWRWTGISGHGSPGYSFGFEWIWAALFIGIHLLLLATPWFARRLTGSTALRWLARGLSAGIATRGLFLLLRIWWDAHGVSAIPNGFLLLTLAAWLNTTGLCLLPGRKPAAPFIPLGQAPEPSAATYDESRSH